MYKVTKILGLLGIGMIFLLPSCRKDRNRIPEVLVDIQVNINNPGYYQLQAVGGWRYFEGGSRGIVVYRRSVDEFLAYDRHCPYNPDASCERIEVDTSSNVIAKDPCCNSRFLLTDGSVQSGPSNFPLKGYQTSYDGQGILRIYN